MKPQVDIELSENSFHVLESFTKYELVRLSVRLALYRTLDKIIFLSFSCHALATPHEF